MYLNTSNFIKHNSISRIPTSKKTDTFKTKTLQLRTHCTSLLTSNNIEDTHSSFTQAVTCSELNLFSHLHFIQFISEIIAAFESRAA